MEQNQTGGVEVVDFNRMKKQSVKIDMNGRVIEETTLEPGANPYSAIQEARRKKLGF